MHSSTYLTALAAALTALFPSSTSALGINCRGSGLCKLAQWENKAPEGVMQILRDAVWQSAKPNETLYQSGDHIICVSNKLPVTLTPSVSGGVTDPKTGAGGEGGASFGLNLNIGGGGICLFPQLPDTTPGLNLGYIRPLMDKLLEHGCGTCGSIPIHLVDQGNNDPSPGILTFNYVKSPSCTGQCIGSDGGATNPTSAKLRGRV